MQIAVISDLHLGAGDAADRFGHDDVEFLSFLRRLEGAFDRIVLLGDVWETLTGRWPGRPDLALEGAMAAHPEIARRFERPHYAYVHGNHDLVAARLLGAPPELTLRDGGSRILLTHGHLHDALIRSARWISELGVWLGGWLLRLGLDGLFRRFEAWESGATRPATDAAGSFERWAVDLARHRDAEIVVTGHTHRAAKAEHGDRLFLNSGHIIGGATTFLHLDTQTGQSGICHAF